MEDLNKDPGRAKDGCGHRLFIWRRGALPTATPHHNPVRLLMRSAGTGSSYSVPSPRGVCCSILMTKRGAGARSRYHTLICLKRASLTMQSAGVHRKGVKAGGCVNDKRQIQPHFFCPWNKGYPISECRWSFTKTKDTFMHFNGGIPA